MADIRLMECRDCGTTVTPTWYWTDSHGKRMSKPRCRDCHEDMMRGVARKEYLNEEAKALDGYQRGGHFYPELSLVPEPVRRHWKRLSRTLYEGVQYLRVENGWVVMRQLYAHDCGSFTPIDENGKPTGGSSFSACSCAMSTRDKLRLEATNAFRRVFRKRLLTPVAS